MTGPLTITVGTWWDGQLHRLLCEEPACDSWAHEYQEPELVITDDDGRVLTADEMQTRVYGLAGIPPLLHL